MYLTHSLMVIDPYIKYGMPMSKLTEAFKYDLEVKGQQKKNYGPDTKTCQKPYKFDLEVKVLGCIWIMNVRDTLSHGDTPMCQIW